MRHDYEAPEPGSNPARPQPPFFGFISPYCPVTFKDPTDGPARQSIVIHSFINCVCKQLIQFKSNYM